VTKAKNDNVAFVLMPLPYGDLEPRLMPRFSYPCKSASLNGLMIVFAVFGWIISVLNTQIDMETTLRQTSVAIGRIYASRSGDAALNGR